MKKYILSPLCSAVIVPGLGQVLNKKILKGLIIMALTFILIIAITFKLAFLIIDEMQRGGVIELDDLIYNKSLSADLSALWILVLISIILWIYSIVDAFFDGLKIEKSIKENSGEILSDR